MKTKYPNKKYELWWLVLSNTEIEYSEFFFLFLFLWDKQRQLVVAGSLLVK